MSRESQIIIDYLKTRLPAQLAGMRRVNPLMVAPDPKTWWAHEQFSGASGVNSTNTPVIMCTVTAQTNARDVGYDGTNPTWKVDYLVRVIVALHIPQRDNAHRLGTHPNKATERHQDTYDAVDDYLTAIMDVLMIEPAVGVLTVQPKGMQAVRYTPADPETIATYGEGEVAFTVTGPRTAITPADPLLEVVSVNVDVKPVKTVPFPPTP